MRRAFGVLVAAVLVATGTPLLVAAPAHATAYRYWSYWHGVAGAWQFAQVGAGTWPVHDGAVEGWRFAVSPGTTRALPPRLPAPGAFDAVCGNTGEQAGKARVALVLDFGVPADAPPGEQPPADSLQGRCVQVKDGANGFAVLGEAGVSVRDESGLVCGLAGYPAVGCGEAVADPTPTATRPTATPSRSAKPTAGPSRSATPTRSREPSRPVDASSSGPPSSGPSSSADRGAPTSGTAASPGPTSAVTGTGPTQVVDPADPSGSTGSTGSADPDTTPSLAAIGTDEPAGSGGSPVPAVLAVVVVAALGTGAYLYRRRAG